jgi:Spy/CpxP family protein refolding chaperone
MKRMMMTMLVLMAGAAAVGAAGFDLPHGKWWENERVVERVGITDEQQRAIGDLVYQHAHRMIDLNAALKKAELELADTVDRDDFDPGVVRQAFASFQAAKQRLESERFEMLLAVRENLTKEQWDQLIEIRRYLERMRDNRQPNDRMPRQRPPYGEPRRPPEGGGFG